MVRAVDQAIKTHFGLADGVADTTTWADYAKRVPAAAVPDNADPDMPVLSMVDPATGTGTFLVELLRQARAGRADRDLAATLDQISALEISLASYAVAHLKVSLELPPEIRHDRRLPIYLADGQTLDVEHRLDLRRFTAELTQLGDHAASGRNIPI